MTVVHKVFVINMLTYYLGRQTAHPINKTTFSSTARSSASGMRQKIRNVFAVVATQIYFRAHSTCNILLQQLIPNKNFKKSKLLLGMNTRKIHSYNSNNTFRPRITLTKFISHTRAYRQIEHSAWCTVHGLVAQHELSVVVCDHSKRAVA